MTLYTLTRQDFLDFEVCPKIVSIKAYRELRAPPRERPPGPVAAPVPNIIGKAAEFAFELAFDEGRARVGKIEDTEAEQRRTERVVLLRLSAYRQWLDKNLRDMVRATSQGIVIVRKAIRETYGPIRVLGHGESRSGIAPGVARLDFVAIRENGRPIIVEIKNEASGLTEANRFQAKYYNSLSERCGVVIRTHLVKGGRLVLTPAQIRDVRAETLLISARSREFESVKDRVDISAKRVKSIWEAKQLGYVGRSAATKCLPNCRHRSYRVDLPEGSAEPFLPLPLAFGIGMAATGADFRAAYFQGLVRRREFSVVWRLFQVGLEQASHVLRKREQITQMTAKRLGLDTSDLELAVRGYRPEVAALEREAADPLIQWRKLVGSKRLGAARVRGRGFATQVYSTPERPERFVRDCERAWS